MSRPSDALAGALSDEKKRSRQTDEGVTGVFKERTRAALGGDIDVHLFWKGRVALYAILRAAGVGPGDEVILPAFTCVVVPSAIVYLGARPVYADVDPHTMNLDAATVSARLTPRTRAILAQNTFGLSPDLDPLLELARRRGILVIEDAAHGFGGRYRNRPNGTSADASFFSSQWNKPFSTGLGGIAVTRDPALGENLAALERAAPPPSLRECASLQLLSIVRRRLLTPALYAPAVAAYRFLSRHDLVLGSSQGWELSAPTPRASFMKGWSAVQSRLGLSELGRMEARLAHRARVASLYRERFSRLGVVAPETPDWATHGHLKYPIRVERRDALLSEAAEKRCEIGDWFLSPIHPIRQGLERWHYEMGQNPVAESLSREVVSLPTHEGIDDEAIDRLFTRIDFEKYLSRANLRA